MYANETFFVFFFLMYRNVFTSEKIQNKCFDYNRNFGGEISQEEGPKVKKANPSPPHGQTMSKGEGLE